MTEITFLAEGLVYPGSMYFIADGVAYFDDWEVFRGSGRGKAWVTFVIEPEEETGEFVVDIACEDPHPKHWLGWLISASSLNDILGLPRGASEQLDWMLKLGVVPGQRFLLGLEYSIYQDYWGECDDDLSFWLMDVEPKTTDQILDELHKARTFVMDGVVLA